MLESCNVRLRAQALAFALRNFPFSLFLEGILAVGCERGERISCREDDLETTDEIQIEI